MSIVLDLARVKHTSLGLMGTDRTSRNLSIITDIYTSLSRTDRNITTVLLIAEQQIKGTPDTTDRDILQLIQLIMNTHVQ